MTITGIIAEFNPFHNGHAFLLQQAKGLKIVAMSGNFMQRGEPAMVDKWTRAQMALENGADLVLELPFLVSVQAADFFAQGAVAILAQLGIEELTFGTEEEVDYGRVANIYQGKEKEMQLFLQGLPDSLSYPQKTQLMWQEFTGLQFSGATPNHVLALAYAKAVAGKAIRLQGVKRQGAGFHSLERETSFASATAIRQHRDDEDFLKAHMPSYQHFQQAAKVTWQDYFPYLRYQIISQPDLTVVYQVNQEMASRLKEAIKEVASVEELVEKVATKRYTKARVRRLLTYILVQAREAQLPQSIHVLGFTEAGRRHLATCKNDLQLVSRIGKEGWDFLTQKADEIYRLGNANIEEQNYGRIPLGLK